MGCLWSFSLSHSLFLGKRSILGMCILTQAHMHMCSLVSSEIRPLERFLSIGWIHLGESPREMPLSNMSLTSCVEGHVGPVTWLLLSNWWMKPHLHDHIGYRVSGDICSEVNNTHPILTSENPLILICCLQLGCNACLLFTSLQAVNDVLSWTKTLSPASCPEWAWPL